MCEKASPPEIFISDFSHVKTKTTVHKTSYMWMFKIALLAITMKANNVQKLTGRKGNLQDYEAIC